MRLIKEKTRFNGRDLQFKINLSSVNNLSGLDQSINDFIEEETGLSINPVSDGETFRYKNNSTTTYSFEFFNGFTYNTSLINAGFTTSEIDNNDDVVANSFFIMQIYDSISNENQTLLHNSYYSGYLLTGATTIYELENTQEFNYLYIPESFINQNTGLTTINLFARFLFFNAKTGRLQLFFNENNSSNETEEKLYYNLTLNVTNRTYDLSTSNIELRELDNIEYVDRFNESLDSFDNRKPVFPTGGQFNNDGTYSEIN